MVQYSRHDIPPAVKGDLTNRQGHDLDLGLEALGQVVLTCWWLGDQFAPQERTDPDPLGAKGVDYWEGTAQSLVPSCDARVGERDGEDQVTYDNRLGSFRELIGNAEGILATDLGLIACRYLATLATAVADE